MNPFAATNTPMLGDDPRRRHEVRQPDGGGHRFTSRQAGGQNSRATANRTGQRTAAGNPRVGKALVHTVIGGHSRIAYAEIFDDEKATAIGALSRAVTWFAARDVTVERVLSDNGSAYCSHAWRDAYKEIGITPKRPRPYQPQTNGKIERFHPTLADGWAYAKFYGNETDRRQSLPAWIHVYSHHGPHTAIGNQPPISRLTNVPGQYS